MTSAQMGLLEESAKVPRNETMLRSAKAMVPTSCEGTSLGIVMVRALSKRSELSGENTSTSNVPAGASPRTLPSRSTPKEATG